MAEAQTKSDEELARELQAKFDEEAAVIPGSRPEDDIAAAELQEAMNIEMQFEEANRQFESEQDEKKAKLAQREMDFQKKSSSFRTPSDLEASDTQ